jgi:polyhydroxyalkanoate synthesis regulator phasin
MPQPKSQSPRRKPAARPKKSGASSTRKRAPAKRRSSAESPARPVQQVVELLSHGVVVTRDRLQEALDDAVKRGRMTPGDANELLLDILRRGRKQTEDVLADIEQLVGRGRGQLDTARRRAGERALREVDRVRRATGVASFPIGNYDDLTAAQVAERLGDLTPAQLRKVRDYERRNANRKSVLSEIEKALG